MKIIERWGFCHHQIHRHKQSTALTIRLLWRSDKLDVNITHVEELGTKLDYTIQLCCAQMAAVLRIKHCDAIHNTSGEPHQTIDRTISLTRHATTFSWTQCPFRGSRC